MVRDMLDKFRNIPHAKKLGWLFLIFYAIITIALIVDIQWLKEQVTIRECKQFCYDLITQTYLGKNNPLNDIFDSINTSNIPVELINNSIDLNETK